MVPIEFDEHKRATTLRERGLDFAQAGQVFTGPLVTRSDTRRDYGEPRFQTLGFLGERVVMVVWTPRGAARRIISMRYAHDSEARSAGLDRPG